MYVATGSNYETNSDCKSTLVRLNQLTMSTIEHDNMNFPTCFELDDKYVHKRGKYL